MNAKIWLIAGALFGLLAVVLGAFGAHGLESAVKNWELSVEDQQGHVENSETAVIDFDTRLRRLLSQQRRLENWETAVRYQMFHALALLAVGALATHRPGASATVAGVSFVVGVLLFSGCLFAWVLTGVKPLVHVVPIGGLILVVGWAALLVYVMRQPVG